MRVSLLLLALALIVGAACMTINAPLVGDLHVTRALQTAFGFSPAWAQWLTETAKPPLVALTILAGAVMASRLAKWRGALAVPLAFGLALTADLTLRALIFVARPASELVAVASASSSSGLPSTFGLFYGSIFGVALSISAPGRQATVIKMLAVALIVAGLAARVVLGGHWTSQMVASLGLGLVAAKLAVVMSFELSKQIASNKSSDRKTRLERS